MSELFFFYHPLTYEDCGVLGGRTLFQSGAEFKILDGSDLHDFAGQLVVEAQEIMQEDSIYPFQRIAVCLILQQHVIVFAITDSSDCGNSTFSYEDVPPPEEGGFDPTVIKDLLFAYDIQAYDILVQISTDVFKVVGYKSPKDEDKFGRAYDVFRCLDIRGTCRIKNTVCDSFRNYIRYELGRDYFIEAYDNVFTKTREFWLGREFGSQKILISSFDSGDEDYLGLFDEDDNLLIDADLAEKICKLTIKEEYVFINNDYELDSITLDIEKADD